MCEKSQTNKKWLFLRSNISWFFKKNHLHIYVYTGADRTALLEGKWYDARSIGKFWVRET